MHRLDHRRPEQRLVDDPALHQPFGVRSFPLLQICLESEPADLSTRTQTHLYHLRTPQVVGDQLVAVHIKVVVVPDEVDPDPLANGWLGAMAIIIEQLALAASVAPDSEAEHTALMIMRWAFLLAAEVFESNVRAGGIPEDQRADVIHTQFLISLRRAINNALIGRHGLEVIEACLPRLTAAHARSAGEREVQRYGAQLHRIYPVSHDDRALETVGQYVEIMRELKPLLEVRTRSPSFDALPTSSS